MTVRLTRIYTKTGDAGQTHLGDMSRVAKTDPRLVAYADVDEANSVIGVALALGGPPPQIAELLSSIQNDLFDVGADLCTPIVPDPQFPPRRITAAYTERLEQACDTYNARLEKLYRQHILKEEPAPEAPIVQLKGLGKAKPQAEHTGVAGD